MKKISSHIYILAILAILFALPAVSSAATIGKSASNSGLVGYWSFNEGAGTTAGDGSGGGNKGTLTNGPIWTSGKLGKALSFDGSNDSVVVSNTASLQTSAAMTISTWVYLTAHSSNINPRIIEKYDDADNGYAMSIGGANNTGRVSFIFKKAGVTYEALVASAALPLNTWVHVSGVFTGSAVNIYTNGISQSLSGVAFVIQDTSGNLLIKVGSAGSPAVSGKLDEVRIYNRALTAAEVMALYKAGGTTQKVANKNGLVAQWKFDEGTSTTAGDVSGYGNKGTLTGATGLPTWSAGKLGKGLTFDGVDDYVAVADNTALQFGTGDFSMGLWVKNSQPLSTDSNIYSLISKCVGGGACNGSPSFWLFLRGGSPYNGLTFRIGASDGLQDVGLTSSKATLLSDGKWHHISVVRNSGTVTLYVDGISSGSGTANKTVNNNTSLLIGSDTFVPPFYLNGSLDDVRIYNRALTAAEVMAIYKENATATNVSQANKLASGLVGYWSFNGADVTDKIYDRVGGNNGYIYGVATSSAKVIGKVGQGLQFDGVDDAIDMRSDFLGTGELSISAWVRPNSYGGGNLARIVDNNKRKLLISSGDGNRFVYSSDAVTNALSGSNSVTLGAWQHVVVTSTAAGVANFYINGVLSGTANQSSGTPGAGTTNVFIGNFTTAGSRSFDGKLDEVRIYNRALSAAEAKQLYNLGR